VNFFPLETNRQYNPINICIFCTGKCLHWTVCVYLRQSTGKKNHPTSVACVSVQGAAPATTAVPADPPG